MTFRRFISLPVLRFAFSRYIPKGFPQINRQFLTAGVVAAATMCSFTFAVGAWTIGAWVFASDVAPNQKADFGGRQTPPGVERLVMFVSHDRDSNVTPAKPEVTQTTALSEVPGLEEKIEADAPPSTTPLQEKAEDTASDRAADAPEDSNTLSRATDIAAQYAEALVDIAIGTDAQSREAEEGTTHAGLAPDSTPSLQPKTVTVAPGDTLMALMVEAGAARSEAHEAITALRAVYSPRRLRPGQDIELTFSTFVPGDDQEANAQGSAEDAPQGGQLMGLSLQSAVDEIVRVARAAVSDDFVAEAITRPLERQVLYGSGTIDSSLFVAARNAGIPNSAMFELIRAFSYDVDFQREIQPGDRFELMYEAFFDENGNMAKTGEILVASLSLSGTPLSLYGFTPSSGFTDFFDEKGQAVRKALLRTPIDGARLSSGFGRRKHPILGYTRMHKGLDFAAPRGTPIYAAGDGVIELAGRNGSYGKYVRIRHHSSYKTAYGHMKGFAKGITRGKRVKQGQVIGYVGTTGRSTGPHLHYEVLRDNTQVNPRNIKLPAGEKLKGKDLKSFQVHRAEIDQLRQTTITSNAQMVQANPADCKAQGTIDESGAAKASAVSSDGC